MKLPSNAYQVEHETGNHFGRIGFAGDDGFDVPSILKMKGGEQISIRIDKPEFLHSEALVVGFSRFAVEQSGATRHNLYHQIRRAHQFVIRLRHSLGSEENDLWAIDNVASRGALAQMNVDFHQYFANRMIVEKITDLSSDFGSDTLMAWGWAGRHDHDSVDKFIVITVVRYPQKLIRR